MRLPGLVLAAFLLTMAGALAQTPMSPVGIPPGPQAKSQANPDAKLDAYLDRWEGEMRKINTLYAKLHRTDTDRQVDHSSKLVGAAYYMKVGTPGNTTSLGLLDLRREGKPEELVEKYVCTGTYIYRFIPNQKTLEAYEMPKPRPGALADDNFLALLFGMKATEAKRRYQMSVSKETEHWVHLKIIPRFPEDRADFNNAELILSRATFLPRRLWFVATNKNEILWDVLELRPGVTLDRRYFDAPKTPQGWKLEHVRPNTGVPRSNPGTPGTSRPKQ